jgi:hypothetical protein
MTQLCWWPPAFPSNRNLVSSSRRFKILFQTRNHFQLRVFSVLIKTWKYDNSLHTWYWLPLQRNGKKKETKVLYHILWFYLKWLGILTNFKTQIACFLRYFNVSNIFRNGKSQRSSTKHHWRRRWGKKMYSSYSITNLALDGSEWSASLPGRALPPGKRPPLPIVQEAVWVPEPVWTQRLEKTIASAGDRTSIARLSIP